MTQISSGSTPASTPKPRRPRPQVMRLTDAAAQRISELTQPGRFRDRRACASASRTAAVPASPTRSNTPMTSSPTDEVVEDKGVKILVDPKAVLFLLGTEMDYKADKMQAQFVFNNPNQVSACGCGKSVELRPAQIDG